jgi:hypothetical protein
MNTATDRQTFRATVAQVAERAKAILPQAVNGRVEKAVTLVLQGDVEPQADGTITVYSATDATRRYVLQGTSCTCADYERGQAPDGWCAHRIAAGIHKRVGELLPAPKEHASGTENRYPIMAQPPASPLPEARCSVNVHIQVCGRDVLLTLRDDNEAALLVRLEEVLQRFPQPQAPVQSASQGWCAKHNVQMTQTQKNGRSWWSHKTADGWCKGK